MGSNLIGDYIAGLNRQLGAAIDRRYTEDLNNRREATAFSDKMYTIQRQAKLDTLADPTSKEYKDRARAKAKLGLELKKQDPVYAEQLRQIDQAKKEENILKDYNYDKDSVGTGQALNIYHDAVAEDQAGMSTRYDTLFEEANKKRYDELNKLNLTQLKEELNSSGVSDLGNHEKSTKDKYIKKIMDTDVSFLTGLGENLHKEFAPSIKAMDEAYKETRLLTTQEDIARNIASGLKAKGVSTDAAIKEGDLLASQSGFQKKAVIDAQMKANAKAHDKQQKAQIDALKTKLKYFWDKPDSKGKPNGDYSVEQSLKATIGLLPKTDGILNSSQENATKNMNYLITTTKAGLKGVTGLSNKEKDNILKDTMISMTEDGFDKTTFKQTFAEKLAEKVGKAQEKGSYDSEYTQEKLIKMLTPKPYEGPSSYNEALGKLKYKGLVDTTEEHNNEKTKKLEPPVVIKDGKTYVDGVEVKLGDTSEVSKNIVGDYNGPSLFSKVPKSAASELSDLYNQHKNIKADENLTVFQKGKALDEVNNKIGVLQNNLNTLDNWSTRAVSALNTEPVYNITNNPVFAKLHNTNKYVIEPLKESIAVPLGEYLRDNKLSVEEKEKLKKHIKTFIPDIEKATKEEKESIAKQIAPYGNDPLKSTKEQVQWLLNLFK